MLEKGQLGLTGEISSTSVTIELTNEEVSKPERALIKLPRSVTKDGVNKPSKSVTSGLLRAATAVKISDRVSLTNGAERRSAALVRRFSMLSIVVGERRPSSALRELPMEPRKPVSSDVRFETSICLAMRSRATIS